MKNAIWIVGVLLLISCGKKEQMQPNIFVPSEIVNGKSVAKKTLLAKSVVALIIQSDQGEALCTGSLIAPHIILTAAHCVDGSPKKITVVFGTKVDKNKNTLNRVANGFLQHPNWHKHLSVGEGDLALIHLETQAPSEYQPVPLVDKNFTLKNNQEVLLAGYGVTDGSSRVKSGVLRQTSSTVLDRHSETEIILDGEDSSVCFGDSGGPAFVYENNQYLQWGVASSVSSSACNETSIHTEVMRYNTWILAAVKRLNLRS